MIGNKLIAIPSGVEGADSAEDIMFTREAVDMITKIRATNNITEDFYLRIAAKGGGCSGMSFMLGFDNVIDGSDRILQSDELELLVDSKSLFYLMGVTLDYVESPEGSGFAFSTPNNMKTCGCGGHSEEN
jgi:iron-sulfur cluster assembly protein